MKPRHNIFSAKELSLIAKILVHASEIEIERKSAREFDLRVCGIENVNKPGEKPWLVAFSSWLPLKVIHQSDWIALARFTDYPEMVQAGDWSGVRDSAEETIWKIFDGIVGHK